MVPHQLGGSGFLSQSIPVFFLSPVAPFHPLIQAFEDFAASLVKQEMANMPRGIYHSALRGGAVRSDQGKTISGVPSFMLKMYERNKQPGLKAGLAGKILLAIDKPFHVAKYLEAAESMFSIISARIRPPEQVSLFYLTFFCSSGILVIAAIFFLCAV